MAEEFRANSLPLNFQGNRGIARLAVEIAAGIGVIAFIGQVADVDRQCGVFVDFIARHDVPYRIGRLPQCFGFVRNVILPVGKTMSPRFGLGIMISRLSKKIRIYLLAKVSHSKDRFLILLE